MTIPSGSGRSWRSLFQRFTCLLFKIKFWKINHFILFSLFVGPGLKTAGSIEWVPFVHPYVHYIRTYILAYLKKCSKDFSEIWYEVGVHSIGAQKYFFFNFSLVGRKILKRILKSQIWCHILVFETLQTNYANNFVKFLPICTKNWFWHSDNNFFKSITLFTWKPLICVKNIDVRDKFGVISGFLRLCEQTVLTVVLKFGQNVQKNCIYYYIEPLFTRKTQISTIFGQLHIFLVPGWKPQGL